MRGFEKEEERGRERRRETARWKKSCLYLCVCVCDFLVMPWLPIGEKRAILTDGIEIQFSRKFIIVSYYNCSPFVYSFSQITCVASACLQRLEECKTTRSYLFSVQRQVYLYTKRKMCQLTSSIMAGKGSASLHCVFRKTVSTGEREKDPGTEAIDQETDS